MPRCAALDAMSMIRTGLSVSWAAWLRGSSKSRRKDWRQSRDPEPHPNARTLPVCATSSGKTEILFSASLMKLSTALGFCVQPQRQGIMSISTPSSVATIRSVAGLAADDLRAKRLNSSIRGRMTISRKKDFPLPSSAKTLDIGPGDSKFCRKPRVNFQSVPDRAHRAKEQSHPAEEIRI